MQSAALSPPSQLRYLILYMCVHVVNVPASWLKFWFGVKRADSSVSSWAMEPPLSGRRWPLCSLVGSLGRPGLPGSCPRRATCLPGSWFGLHRHHSGRHSRRGGSDLDSEAQPCLHIPPPGRACDLEHCPESSHLPASAGEWGKHGPYVRPGWLSG